MKFINDVFLPALDGSVGSLTDRSEAIQLLIPEIKAEMDRFSGFVSSIADSLVTGDGEAEAGCSPFIEDFVCLLLKTGYSLTFVIVIVLHLISILVEVEMRTSQNLRVIFPKCMFGLSGLPICLAF